MKGRINEIISWMLKQDKATIYQIEVFKEKRSLNANNYAWALISQIADKMRMSKEDVYLRMLKDYGKSEVVSVLASIDVDGYFKYYSVYGKSKLNDKEFIHYKVYKGTSEYNTQEMSIFIDGVVQEADNLGIETKTPDEIERLKRLWDNE